MQDIKGILKENAPELPEEAAKAIIEAVGENYRTIKEAEQKAQRITALEAELAERDEAIKQMEGAGAEVEALRAKVTEFEAAEAKRTADEAEAQKRRAFEQSFDAALDGREFANGMLRETVLDRAYKLCADSEGLGVKDAIDSLTKDQSGVWVNPQADPKKMPGSSDMTNSHESNADQSKRAFAARLFGSGSKE